MTKEKEYVIGKIRKLKGRQFKALLGMGDSAHTVAVTGKASYVWIRLKFGSTLAAPVQALNRHVPPIHGTLVKVQEIDVAGKKGFEVIDWDSGVLYYHDTTTYEDLPAHGWTHESGPGAGSDPVNLYTRGWAELRVEPTVPCSMQTYVTYGWYLFDIPTWFSGGNSPALVPPALGSRMDLIYLDSSGTVGIEQGTIAILPATPAVPEPPDYTIPLAAIELTGTSIGCITEDMILDCRVMPNVKAPILFDDSVQPLAVEAGLPCWPGNIGTPARRDHRHQLVEPLELLDGAAGAPSYSFASDNEKGMYNLGDGALGFATGGVLRTELDATGSMLIGDCVVNFTRFMPDGEMLRYGTARTLNALWIGAEGLKAPPLVKPAEFVIHGIAGAWEFADGDDETVIATMRIPNRMDRRVAPTIGLGWSSPVVDPGDDSKQATWQVEYLWTGVDEDTTAAAEGTLSVTDSASTLAGGDGLVFSVIALTAPATTDYCLHMRIKRRGDTDSLGGVAHLIGICMEFTSNKLGTAL